MIQPPSILNMGAPGSGKTWSLSTFIANKIRTFVVFTEPTGPDSFIDAIQKQGLDMELAHWSYLPPASPGWSALREAGLLANALSYKDLSELKMGVAKSEMKQFGKLLDLCENFKCDRTGKSYGPIEVFGPECAFVIDSLSGLNHIVMQNSVGFKSSPHQGEWGIAMSLEENIILKISSDITSYFILNCHISREPDELIGTTRLVPAALGSKLGPRIPRFFSEHVLSVRTGDKFLWRTSSGEADLKSRILPVKQELAPDYTPIIKVYGERVEAAKKAA